MGREGIKRFEVLKGKRAGVGSARVKTQESGGQPGSRTRLVGDASAARVCRCRPIASCASRGAVKHEPVQP